MKTEDIKRCNSINEYLKIIHKDSIDDLTFNEIADWVKAEKMDSLTRFSVEMVEYGYCDHFPNKRRATKLLRQAIKEGKSFSCSYIMNESADEPCQYKYKRFEMELTELFV